MVVISLGVAARSIIANDTAEDLVLLNLVKSIMPVGGYTLLLVVLVSIVMSSLDSLLNAGAVCFTQDIIKPFMNLPNGTALNTGRIATIIIAAVAAVGAVAVHSIIDGLLICYTIWAPAILPALIIGLWVKNPRPLAGILSMAVGSIVAVMLWLILSYMFKVARSSDIEIPPLVIIPALSAALLAYALGNWIETVKSRK
jgi:SSS family solute:Na+ symporter